MKVTIFFILLGITTVVGAIVIPVRAQENGNRTSISITPPLSEIVMQPGRSITQAFTIANDGTVDLEVIPTIVDFSPDENTGAPIVFEKNENFPYAELQNLDKKFGKPFLLPAGSKDQLILRITIPNSELDKDYYKTLLLKTSPSGLAQVDGVQTVSQAYIGVHILLSVSGNGEDRATLAIEKLTVPRIIDMFSSIPITMIVKNLGTNYTQAHGQVSIASTLGKVVKIFPLLPENVIAGSIRKLQASVQDPDDTKSAIAAPMDYRPLFLLGQYTITATVGRENQESPDEKIIKVFALPISPAVVIFSIWLALKLVSRH
ncbi:MAG: hypothetical protein AAB612_03300 [Patescibacteria group bacterium]